MTLFCGLCHRLNTCPESVSRAQSQVGPYPVGTREASWSRMRTYACVFLPRSHAECMNSRIFLSNDTSTSSDVDTTSGIRWPQAFNRRPQQLEVEHCPLQLPHVSSVLNSLHLDSRIRFKVKYISPFHRMHLNRSLSLMARFTDTKFPPSSQAGAKWEHCHKLCGQPFRLGTKVLFARTNGCYARSQPKPCHGLT